MGTLSMVAIVAATPAATPAAKWAQDKVHAATCAAPTKVDAAALSVANLTWATRTAFLEKLVDEVTAATTKTATDLGDLHTCWAKTTGDAFVAKATVVTAAQKALNASEADCGKEWNTWNTSVTAEWTATCEHTHALADKSAKGGGAVVGIIIGCIVGVCCIAGAAWYFCVHKKKGDAADAMFNDDLYEAFVDTETA